GGRSRRPCRSWSVPARRYQERSRSWGPLTHRPARWVRRGSCDTGSMSDPAPGAHLVAGMVDEGETAAAARPSGQPLIDLGGDLVAHGAAGEVGGDLVDHTRPLRQARL